MAVKPIPPPNVPFVDMKGMIAPVWYEYLKSRETVGIPDLPGVKLTALTNGDALVWNSADGKWENVPN